MEIRIEPYQERMSAEARALNDRLRAGGESEFMLSEHAPPPDAENAILRHRYSLMLEGDRVRGGFLLVEYPGWLGTAGSGPVLNCLEPLSEGIVDPRYRTLGVRIISFSQRQNPHVFAIGLGSAESRYARLLKAAGWDVRLVPFLFHVHNASRFLREARPLQNRRPVRWMARAAALSGLGSIALGLLQARGAFPPGAGMTIEPVEDWGEWADELWAAFRPLCSFAVSRDRATLRELYPLDRTIVFLIRRHGKPAAWVAALNTAMSGNKYFGNLRVATILDGAARPEAMAPAIAMARRALAARGADLIVSNQSHALWIRAFRQAGFLGARSNYVLALSKPLAAAISAQDPQHRAVHFTRGDGDGRIHL